MSAGTEGLSDAELRSFHEKGWVVKRGVVDRGHLARLAAAISEQVGAEVAKLVAKGELPREHAYPDAPFAARLGKVARALRSVEAKTRLVARFMGIYRREPLAAPLLACIRHPPFVAALESVLGPVVVGGVDAPVRGKVPVDDDVAATAPGACRTPWHQDAIFRPNPNCDRVLSVQCWVPLVDATVRNGCLWFMPYRFEEGLLPHYAARGGLLGVHADDLPRGRAAEPAEARVGDVVLWSNMTPHTSFYNRSADVRWSMDWRFHGADKPTNVDEPPESYYEHPERDPATFACSFPSGDFVLRDRANPAREARDGASLAAARRRYDDHIGKTGKMYPGPRWRPIRERPGHAAGAPARL